MPRRPFLLVVDRVAEATTPHPFPCLERGLPCVPNMRTNDLLILATLALMLGVPAFAHAQSTGQVSSALIGRAFDKIVAQNAAPDPEPVHTGFKALARDTWGDFRAFPRRPSTWVILGIGAGAALLAHPVDDDVNARLVGRQSAKRFWAPGKVIGSAPTQAALSIGLYAIGRYVVKPDPSAPVTAGTSPRTNKWSHLGFDLLRAQIVSQTFVHSIKYAVRRDRPTGECCSFPSGHAASAFAAASVLERHFGYRMSVPSMVIATYVATSRLHDNRHFLSDVVFGAALGTATGWTVVGRHGRSSYALNPVAVPGGFALQITHVDRSE